MPDSRVYGFEPRHLAYNEWHRIASISRFIDRKDAIDLTAIDLDLVEFKKETGEVVLLHETALYTGQPKQTRVLRALAIQAKIPALCTLYELSDKPNPSNTDVPDIAAFHVKLVWHPIMQNNPWSERLTPSEYANKLNKFVRELKSRS